MFLSVEENSVATGAKFHFFRDNFIRYQRGLLTKYFTLVVSLKEVWVLIKLCFLPSDLRRITARTYHFVWGGRVVSPGVKTAGVLGGPELHVLRPAKE